MRAESITALGDVMSRWPGAHRRDPSHLQTILAFIQGPPPGPSRVPGGPGPSLQVTPGQPSRKKEEVGGAELEAFNTDIPNLANQSGTSKKAEVEAELLPKCSAGAGNRKLPPRQERGSRSF